MRWVLRLRPVLGRDPLIPVRNLTGLELACRSSVRRVMFAAEFNYTPLTSRALLGASDFGLIRVFLGNSALGKRMRVTHRA